MAAHVLEQRSRVREARLDRTYVGSGIVQNEILQLLQTSIDAFASSFLHDRLRILQREITLSTYRCSFQATAYLSIFILAEMGGHGIRCKAISRHCSWEEETQIQALGQFGKWTGSNDREKWCTRVCVCKAIRVRSMCMCSDSSTEQLYYNYSLFLSLFAASQRTRDRVWSV